MKLNNYTKFLKEAIRDDEYSNLNDDLENFNKMSNRWDDSTYTPQDEYGYKDQYDDDDDDNGSDDEEGMYDLIRLFKQMFSNSNIERVEIEGTPDEISMFFTLNYRERLRDIVRIFEVLSKIKKDILPQFYSEIDLWKDKKGNPLLMVTFKYSEGLYDDDSF
jgi:hypothetical protein